ncbi:MAG: outer membrane beta-barrel protein [Taibaiella sp.]|nr:outer membrane beta-barrel protein [Taibaiella sp.]
MKYIFTTLTSFLFLTSINAQQKAEPKFRVQVETGVSHANMHIDLNIPNLEPIPGKRIIKFTPGIWGDLRLGNKTNFEFGFHHYQSGTRYFERKFYKEEFILKYVRLHTNFKYKLIKGKSRSNLFVTAGPYLAYLGSGTFTYNGAPVIAHKGQYKSYKRFDYGLAYSIGYMTPVGLYARVSYAHGIPNVYKPVDETDLLVLRNINNWMFNIGYQF